MKKLSKYFSFFYLKISFYYVFSSIFGKLIYPRLDFNSKYFVSPGSCGWSWVFHSFWWQKIIGINKSVPWPVSFRILISSPENIFFHPDDLNNFMTFGNYFQAIGAKIIIGKGTYIAPNVGIITQNHDIRNPDVRAEAKSVILGDKCWIGMNSMILPGVELGPNTVVGAGSVVTKSFKNGYCVIAGNPAIIIKKIDII